MRYDQNDRESSNVEDRRGEGGGGMFPGGGIQIPIGGKGGFSITTLLIIGALMMFMGINPLDVLFGTGGQINMPQMPHSERPAERSPGNIPGLPGSPQTQTASEDDEKAFISRVLADTEDVWTAVFKSFGRTYPDPKLVIYSGITRTACGAGQAAMGPFYCPLDQKVYVDLAFYDELKRRFNVSGDFAQAYVIAHEVGHHVQKQLGILDKVQELKERAGDEATANHIQVRTELQADCLAGVWANLNDQMKKRLQPGDIEEALNAASQIGDDMIQKRMTGRIVPDAFTHGTAAQRVHWFKTGFETGRMDACDTFNTSSP
ncbi:KPN_02809 family neutral zinc metallopeptidase [Hyphomicrobium sp.]|jgi:predicted metalloprotease|uniref:KPN_02809 family neutral zinc metallopeptidase n=1 Tax=Hyphomicrobium sp. TaxID=82 RepID=UPI002D0A108A|nr:neutral zinc metallopeptidase [Hyphomicrobium sp.]HVZ06270.1 neutral zinc metallopeptidase [Hyphomicrobium sp.]